MPPKVQHNEDELDPHSAVGASSASGAPNDRSASGVAGESEGD